MRYTESEKAAQALIDAASTFSWNPMLFAGHLLNEHNTKIQENLIDGMVYYLVIYQQNAANPSLSYRADSVLAEKIEPVDLTEFDHPW
jgi:hypothetical protein